ncbi:TrkH family potassium uptake protein [Pseudanabaena galeata UHCC 0370]|uniref:TrkH family potassium uptake protein n=1 Tax=Pseudanabaena galeata UHCC 0370 TaxID=3110310 RepID=A0ABU5TR69_9CYAN|nr:MULTISPECIES: TrkH family potassium uptake protein [Pseudanabaena]MEA5480597.1 TrkH family potassium uptake protein [Pseudanabaena galeata UHCC 0370]MEA5489054.1 TrkH family potassium uptake protein [Pseudanabaena sp. CCNP1317]WGS73108.1 TrkH family potassium uptake protein [Pseudanabaena galeata CCNP1313]
MNPARTICLGFVAVIIFGAFLLMLPISSSSGTWSNPITSLFTSTSAVCVTGLSVVDVGKFYSLWGQIFLMLLFQIGGLGYMTATSILLILIGRKFSLRDKITLQQSLDTKGIRGARQLVKSIIAVTFLLELTGAIALIPIFNQRMSFQESVWQALFHSVSAFNNAGFSLFSDSLMGYVNIPSVNIIIGLLIIFGGIGYQVILEGYLWLRPKFSRDREYISFSLTFCVVTTTTIALMLFGTLFFWLTEFSNSETLGKLPLFDQIIGAWFQSVTTRTAGFNTIDNGKMTVTGLFITIALMFIGASPGGTGGGIKTTTARILASCTRAALQGRDEVTMYKLQVPNGLILKAVGVAVGSLFTVICSTGLLSLTDRNISFINILFESTSAFATVGLSTGITSSLSWSGQLIIIATMYIGRVGVLLLMAAIFTDTRPSLIKYPQESMLVG